MLKTHMAHYLKLKKKLGIDSRGCPFQIIFILLQKQDEIILDQFNLKVKAGQSVALVGHTGSGKTTLINLLSRFYEPTSGVIEIDGKDYKIEVFNGSINNLDMFYKVHNYFQLPLKKIFDMAS